jgi:ribonuclease P protein component
MKGRPEKGRFGPERRVRKRPEFLQIQARGRRIPTKDFVLIVAPAEEPSSLPRLGITASKRVGNSVQRNRVKRVIRAAFRQLPKLLPPGFDLVVICKGPPTQIDLDTVVQQWRGAEKRLNKAIAQLKPRE